MYSGTRLSGDGIDLDNYKTGGRYVITSSSTAVNGSNFPQNSGGYLDVIQRTDYQSWQYFHTFNNNHYCRVWSGTAWTDWKSIT